MSNPIWLYDRSRVTTDWQCPRKRYLQYHLMGKGVVNSNTSLELFMGITLHDALAAIGLSTKLNGTVDIDGVASTARKQMIDSLLAGSDGEVEAYQFANEQAALVEGLLRGFYRYSWPSLLERYPHITVVEGEMMYSHSNLSFMSKPDLVMEDGEGELWYVEYKSTSSKREEWVNSWNTAVQLHSTLRAIEKTIDRKVTGVVVQGLYKGYQSYGKQNSPFCYGYHRHGNPPFVQAETLYEYKAGYKRYPVWEMEGGVKDWVEGMPEHVLASQFPQAPPIFVRDHLVDAFFSQREVRENEIREALKVIEGLEDVKEIEKVLNAHFPQRFDQCVPSFGKPCGYRKLCHGNGEDPFSLGFEFREPHHEAESKQWEEAEGG